jgi:CheY-like chemotaxis protein
VIDDDPNIRQMLHHMLEREGFEVSTASNGNEALAMFRAQPADLVITDIIMPEKEGIETIRELKGAFPDTKIIAISGGGRVGPSDYLKMAKLLGAQRTIAKPFDRSEMLSAVKEAIGATEGN